MKKNILFPIFLSFVLGCTSDSTLDTQIEAIQPACLQPIIKGVLEKEPTNPKANIQKYLYNNSEVFVINIIPGNGAGDFEASVLDTECNLICLLGGIDGQPSTECSDFNETAQFIETIWADPR